MEKAIIEIVGRLQLSNSSSYSDGVGGLVVKVARGGRAGRGSEGASQISVGGGAGRAGGSRGPEQKLP